MGRLLPKPLDVGVQVEDASQVLLPLRPRIRLLEGVLEHVPYAPLFCLDPQKSQASVQGLKGILPLVPPLRIAVAQAPTEWRRAARTAVGRETGGRELFELCCFQHMAAKPAVSPLRRAAANVRVVAGIGVLAKNEPLRGMAARPGAGVGVKTARAPSCRHESTYARTFWPRHRSSPDSHVCKRTAIARAQKISWGWR